MTTTIDLTGFNKKIKELQKTKKTVMPKAHVDFVRNTPVQTGNAKNKTILQNLVIYANYPYAAILNAGRLGKRGSKQAPKGMVQPTYLKLKQYILEFVRRIK